MVLTIVFLMQSIMMTFAVERCMRVFFEKIRNRRMIFWSYLFYFIVPSLVFLYFNIPIINMLIAIPDFYTSDHKKTAKSIDVICF